MDHISGTTNPDTFFRSTIHDTRSDTSQQNINNYARADALRDDAMMMFSHIENDTNILDKHIETDVLHNDARDVNRDMHGGYVMHTGSNTATASVHIVGDFGSGSWDHRLTPANYAMHAELFFAGNAVLSGGNPSASDVIVVNAAFNSKSQGDVAKDTAAQANRARCDFLATVSHEMRTPLNAVIGYSERLLTQSDLGAEARRSGERIQNAAAALLALVDDIMDLDKIEAGIIDVRREPFSLSALIEDAVSYVRPLAMAKGLALNIQYDGAREDFFLGDQHRIRQVLLNLLGNAIKFTWSGKVDLSIESQNDGETRRQLRFAVADTGIGIIRSEHEAVFERFHQANLNINGEFGGAGLGLAIAKQLVERMGGSIHLESAPEQGSTFWFELTLDIASPTQIVPAEKSHARPARILVADDIAVSRELAQELLEERGYQVEVVSNGRDAVEAVKAGAFDMVLMDLSMPEMNGLDATRLIRSADIRVNTTPIIAWTANATPARMAALRAAGVNAFLRKPLRQTELYATVDRILTQRLAQADLEVPALPRPELADFLRNIIALLGPERVIKALDEFTGELKAFTGVESFDVSERGKLGARAHAVISTACALNFTQLSAACRDLENACVDDVGIPNALERLGPHVTAALHETERLRRDCRLYIT